MFSSTSSSLWVLSLLLLQGMQEGAFAELVVRAITPSSRKHGKPNTFIGTTGSQIATSLLASNTPALLWGIVQSKHVTTVCQDIVRTGSFQYTAKISGDWGGSETIKLKVLATGGCGAARDSSGVEFVFTDNFRRKSAIVCPNGAGRRGCGVYMTGADINRLYHKAKAHIEIVSGTTSSISARRLMLGDCQEEAGKGAVGGAITGVMGVTECLALGPLAIFCAAGVIGVSAELGALAGCATSCFPGEAKVQMISGEFRPLQSLQIGDKVAVARRGNGKIIYDDVYAFGHKDASAVHEFYNIDIVSTQYTNMLQLSALHFVPTRSGKKLLYKRARDVRIGDIMWAANHSTSETMSEFTVAGIRKVMNEGVYNPLTLSGTIIVDGVAASCHSDWFLDSIFDALGLTSWLPSAYQLILSPVQMLYCVLGRDKYASTYNWLDERMDLAQFGTDYGGGILIAAAMFIMFAAQNVFSLL